METSGDPPTDLPIDADFEYQRPGQSVGEHPAVAARRPTGPRLGTQRRSAGGEARERTGAGAPRERTGRGRRTTGDKRTWRIHQRARATPRASLRARPAPRPATNSTLTIPNRGGRSADTETGPPRKPSTMMWPEPLYRRGRGPGTDRHRRPQPDRHDGQGRPLPFPDDPVGSRSGVRHRVRGARIRRATGWWWALAAIAAGFFVTLPKVPDRVTVFHLFGLIFPLVYTFVLTQRQRKDSAALNKAKAAGGGARLTPVGEPGPGPGRPPGPPGGEPPLEGFTAGGAGPQP